MVEHCSRGWRGGKGARGRGRAVLALATSTAASDTRGLLLATFHSPGSMCGLDRLESIAKTISADPRLLAGIASQSGSQGSDGVIPWNHRAVMDGFRSTPPDMHRLVQGRIVNKEEERQVGKRGEERRWIGTEAEGLFPMRLFGCLRRMPYNMPWCLDALLPERMETLRGN